MCSIESNHDNNDTQDTSVCPVVNSYKVGEEPYSAVRFDPTRDHSRVLANSETTPAPCGSSSDIRGPNRKFRLL